MYVRFACVEDRELAMRTQPFFLEGATVRLFREEEADRFQARMPTCVAIIASRVPIEYFSVAGVTGLFAKYGQVLEVDPACFTGADCATIRAVVQLRQGQLLPEELAVSRKPWGTRIVVLRGIKVWPAQDFFDVNGAYVRFFGPPPRPLFHPMSGRAALPPPPLPAAPASEDGSRGDPALGGRDDEALAHDALLAILDSVASSPELGFAPGSPGSSSSTMSTLTIS
jgi:hypothetical protein